MVENAEKLSTGPRMDNKPNCGILRRGAVSKHPPFVVGIVFVVVENAGLAPPPDTPATICLSKMRRIFVVGCLVGWLVEKAEKKLPNGRFLEYALKFAADRLVYHAELLSRVGWLQARKDIPRSIG